MLGQRTVEQKASKPLTDCSGGGCRDANQKGHGDAGKHDCGSPEEGGISSKLRYVRRKMYPAKDALGWEEEEP